MIKKRVKTLKNEKLRFCAKITYPWMSCHLFHWIENPKIDKKKKNELFRNNSEYLVTTFINNIEKSTSVTDFDKRHTNAVNVIRKSYKNYHQTNCFGTYAKWLDSFLKVAYLMDCLSIKEEFLHCPIDETILKKIKNKERNWSKFHKEQYQSAISKIRKIAGSKTVFAWELNNWNSSKLGGTNNE